MKTNFIKATLFLLCVTVASVGYSRSKNKNRPSGVILNLGLYTSDLSETIKTTTKSETESGKNIYNTTLGWVAENGFMIIGKYYAHDGQTKVGGAKATESASSYGLGLGFHIGSFYLSGSYMLDPTVEKKVAGVKTKYSKGSGLLAEFGFIYALASHFWVGPQITYTSYSMDNQSIGGVKSTNFKGYEVSEWTPQMVFTISF